MMSTLTGDLDLSCEVSIASAVVAWKKDQVEIQEDQRTSMASKGTQRRLIIKSAKKTDGGHYSCEVAGDKVTFHVKIKGDYFQDRSLKAHLFRVHLDSLTHNPLAHLLYVVRPGT